MAEPTDRRSAAGAVRRRRLLRECGLGRAAAEL
jgi:hypothetical protein